MPSITKTAAQKEKDRREQEAQEFAAAMRNVGYSSKLSQFEYDSGYARDQRRLAEEASAAAEAAARQAKAESIRREDEARLRGENREDFLWNRDNQYNQKIEGMRNARDDKRYYEERDWNRAAEQATLDRDEKYREEGLKYQEDMDKYAKGRDKVLDEKDAYNLFSSQMNDYNNQMMQYDDRKNQIRRSQNLVNAFHGDHSKSGTGYDTYTPPEPKKPTWV